MFSNHVSRQLSAFMHDELSSEGKGSVAKHLIACPNCRAEFEDVKHGARFAEQLQIVSAPDSVWAGVVAQLDDKRVRRMRFWFVKPLAIAALILVVVAGGLLLLRSNSNTGGAPWNVARLDGSPRINSQNIVDGSKLGVGQWLETDGTSRAQIDVATIGNVEIDPNSRVRLLETSSSEHRLELERGRLSAHISAPPKLFFVNTPSGVAEDLGCAYTLEVDENGNSILHVTLGWVSLQLTDRESSVPAGAACAMRRGVGPGTPYFEDASELFRTALSKFDFADNQSDQTTTLAALLSEARPRDVMTLWYLLMRVSAVDRANVYDRMTSLVTPPQEVTREGVLDLNAKMLERWKAKLSIRSELPQKKVHSFWKKLWAETLGRIHGYQGKW